MPATDSPAVIVARFLKSNNYSESYDAFITESGLPRDAGTVSKGDLTLEVILEEKKAFDLSSQFEKLGEDDNTLAWTASAPSVATEVTTLPSKSNLLHVSIETVLDDRGTRDRLFATTVDRRLNIINVPDLTLSNSTTSLHDASILSCAVLYRHFFLSTSMSGNLILSDLKGKILERRKDHTKFTIQVALLDDGDESYIATIGWDCKANVYQVQRAEVPKLGEPICTIELQTKPEAVAFLRHPVDGKPLLLISQTDSSFLHYYTVTENPPRLIGKQNLAPLSNAWVALTPSAIALSPKDPTLLAVATSTVPHLKVIIVRLLVPPYDGTPDYQPSTGTQASLLNDTAVTETQASQARAALAVADREAAAIQIHCSTFAPQTAYSTPDIAWRPDASGVWVNGDDGVVRGIEANTGKVVVTLQGHQAGTKIRCLWAGNVVTNGKEEEWLISGGFDQKLLIWRAAKD
ncbi:hypothetical protein K431DRAFT_64423 [Polychaeton citri CBS 116435]|uniref:LisH domain-containing protein n=1 Tax=Polychaeton citri CBS 116435 TaxID=1314669 RepID=A0A9P4Q9A9_9PEZI|nr:hypothetical protein K431DRAFT_64423 [Polychaeton citri CBS 116435]